MLRVGEAGGAITANLADTRWLPLKITATLLGPIMFSGHRLDLHLDGIIAAGAFRLYRRPVEPIDSPWVVDFDLPLARFAMLSPLTRDTDPRLTLDGQIYPNPDDPSDAVPHGWIWGWAASNAAAKWLLAGRMEVRKRPETGRMAQWTRDKSFHLSLGAQKAYNLDYPTVFAHEVTWYALGDPEGVMACLSQLTHIGKKHNQGNGRVGRWTVEVVDPEAEGVTEAQARNFWCWKDGVIMRRMPIAFAPDRIAVWAAVRGPYHHHSRRAMCVDCTLPAGPEVEGDDLEGSLQALDDLGFGDEDGGVDPERGSDGG